MSIHVLFFAALRDGVGRHADDYHVEDGETVHAVWERVLARYPQVEAFRGITRFALNGVFADGTAAVRDGDELAFLPPMSGG